MMKQSTLKTLRAVHEQALRWICGKFGSGFIGAKANVYRELEIATVEAIATGQRARLYAKAVTMRTWIRDLVTTKPSTKRWTWMTRTMRWLARSEVDTSKCRPKIFGQTIRNIV